MHVQRRIAISDTTAFALQAGMLDQLTGELAHEYERVPTAGERTGTPAVALRGGFQRRIGTDRAMDFGVERVERDQARIVVEGERRCIAPLGDAL